MSRKIKGHFWHRMHIKYPWLVLLFIIIAIVGIYFGMDELWKWFGSLAVEATLHHGLEFAEAAE